MNIVHGSYIMYYNEELELGSNKEQEHQLVHAQTAKLGKALLAIRQPVKHYKFNNKPSELTMSSYLQVGDGSLAEAAILAYDDTDEKLEPVQRAREAFKAAFGRAVKTKQRPHEAVALADIVAGNHLLHGKEEVKGETDELISLDSDGDIPPDPVNGDGVDIQPDTARVEPEVSRGRLDQVIDTEAGIELAANSEPLE